MFWQSLLDWGLYVLKHKEQTEKNSADITGQQEGLDDVVDAVQELKFEVRQLRDNEAHEREKLALRLENLLLRERALPPGTAISSASNEALRREMAELKRQNEELRRRLEQREIE